MRAASCLTPLPAWLPHLGPVAHEPGERETHAPKDTTRLPDICWWLWLVTLRISVGTELPLPSVCVCVQLCGTGLGTLLSAKGFLSILF